MQVLLPRPGLASAAVAQQALAPPEAQSMSAADVAQPSAEANPALRTVASPAVTDLTSYAAETPSIACPSKSSSMTEADSSPVPADSTAADPVWLSSSSHAGYDSQAAPAGIMPSTDASHLAETSHVTAAEQVADAAGTADMVSALPSAVWPNLAATPACKHAAVALHTAAGNEVSIVPGQIAADGGGHTSYADDAAAAGLHISCATDTQQVSLPQGAAQESLCPGSTAGQPTVADRTAVDVQQPACAHSSVAAGVFTSLDDTTPPFDSKPLAAHIQGPSGVARRPGTAGGIETPPAMPCLPPSATKTRVGMVPSVLAKCSAVVDLVKALLMPAQHSQPIRDKGKGRATAADLQRMAAQAGEDVGSTVNQSRLTKSEMHQLRTAHREADFASQLEAGKRAGAGPSHARSSVTLELLHTAAEVAYYIAGAVKGSCEGLLRAFWRVRVT